MASIVGLSSRRKGIPMNSELYLTLCIEQLVEWVLEFEAPRSELLWKKHVYLTLRLYLIRKERFRASFSGYISTLTIILQTDS